MAKCKNCKAIFEPRSFNRKFCDADECNDLYFEELKKKALSKWSKKKKAKKEELKTVSDLMKEVQVVCNAFIRERDKNKGCISCGCDLSSKFDAGHYFSSFGHKNITFNLDNIHAQCVACNQYKHGNLIQYQIGIQKRIGAERLLKLHELAHKEYKPTRDELRKLKKKFQEKLAALKKNA